MAVAGFGIIFASFGAVVVIIGLLSGRSTLGPGFVGAATIGFASLIVGAILIGGGYFLTRSNRSNTVQR
jgi:hypothetical protein